jgi:hypothetical protein
MGEGQRTVTAKPAPLKAKAAAPAEECGKSLRGHLKIAATTERMGSLLTGGSGFGLGGFFVQFACGHAFGRGIDLAFMEEFFVRGDKVGRRGSRRLRFRNRTWGTRRRGCEFSGD